MTSRHHPGEHARTRGARGRLAAAGVAPILVLVIIGGAVASALTGPGAVAVAARPGSVGIAAHGSAPAAARSRTASSEFDGSLSGAASAFPRAAGRGHGDARFRARRSALRTSCRSVAHIGDSTSADLISPDYLPDPAQRLAARYADVGVRSLRVDASGGRSIVEALPGQVNGYNVARAWRSEGFRGCWVLALGTNDTANVAVGSAVGLRARIDRMMSVAHGEPVLWVNTATLLSGGPWAESNERLWDDTLVAALAAYPNLRILDWAAVAQPGWFLPDGIHYNSAGCAARARAIADGLARAFPRSGHAVRRIIA